MARRIAEKEASRVLDAQRLHRGEVTADQLQEENSAFPMEWIRNAKIENLSDAAGK